MPAVEQIGANGDRHRQGADNHGRNRGAGTLNGAGQAEIVEQVADGGEFERLAPVFAAKQPQPMAIEPGQR